MNFQTQDRKGVTLSEEHKYITEMSRYGRCIQNREELIGLELNENIQPCSGSTLTL